MQKLVTNLFKSTTPKGSQSRTRFGILRLPCFYWRWCFICIMKHRKKNRTLRWSWKCSEPVQIEDEEDTRPSPLDELFAELEMTNSDHIALKYYRSYHSGSAKTLKSIQITLAARLEKFNLESLASLTSADELDLPSMGEKKVALFALYSR